MVDMIAQGLSMAVADQDGRHPQGLGRLQIPRRVLEEGGAARLEVEYCGGARVLSQTVHLLPPSALFPRHWRDAPAGVPIFGSLASQPLFPRLGIPEDLESFLRPPPAATAAPAAGGADAARPATGAVAGAANVHLGSHAFDCTWGVSAGARTGTYLGSARSAQHSRASQSRSLKY